MLDSFKTKDTLEDINYNDIKDDCVVCDTHLTAILEVTGANLFEKKEAESISFMNGLSKVLGELSYPMQLVSQSRPKDFSYHIRKIKKDLQKNDYKLKFKKDLEWFQLYYQYDLHHGNITEEQIQEKFEKAPEYIERSMLDSYIERLETMIHNNNILEKKYYFVISTLDQPSKFSEKEDENYSVLSFDNEDVFYDYKDKLDERCKHAINLIIEHTWMWVIRKQTLSLENILFDYFNFPASNKHKINPYITEYWTIPPILDNSNVNQEQKEEENFLIKNGEKIINLSLKKFAETNQNKNKKSNSQNQLLKPFSIDDSNMWFLKINDSYTYTIHINKFGDDYLEDLVLWPILTMKHFFDLSIHLIPQNRQEVLLELKKWSQRIERNYQEKTKGKSIAEVELEKDDATSELWKINVLESHLTNKHTWLFATSIDITFRAGSQEELYEIKESVKQKLSTKRIFYSETTGNHLDWFLSTAPVLKNHISGYKKIFKKNLDTIQQVTHYYPYCPDSIVSEDGLSMGISKQWAWDDEMRNITFFDYFDRTRSLNSNTLVIWQSGSWKTTQAHQLFRTQELLGNKHLIIDFLGNYINWAKDTPDKYRVIKIDPTSNDKINPCDIIFPSNKILSESENYKGLSIEEIKNKIIDDKISELSAYYRMFLKTTYDNPIIVGILDTVTKDVYKKALKDFNITEDKFYWNILLSDIVSALNKWRTKDKKDLATMLEPYASWSYAWMFNSKTNIDISDNRSIVFYLRGASQGKYRELAILQSFILIKRIAYSSSNNILAIDELHEIFRIESNEVQNFFRSQIATIRNLDGWVLWMTQFLDQVLNTQAWKEFFKLAVTKLYLAWWLTDSDDENSILNYEKSLSNASKSYLLNNNRPWYWVLLLGWEQIQLKIDNHPDMSLFQKYKPPKD